MDTFLEEIKRCVEGCFVFFVLTISNQEGREARLGRIAQRMSSGRVRRAS